MNILRIDVQGYSRDNPCHGIRKTFYVRDEAEFGVRVLAWERENNIMEWTKTNRR